MPTSAGATSSSSSSTSAPSAPAEPVGGPGEASASSASPADVRHSEENLHEPLLPIAEPTADPSDLEDDSDDETVDYENDLFVDGATLGERLAFMAKSPGVERNNPPNK